jgi:serine/threonine-protein kinase
MLRANAVGYQPMADTAIAVSGGQKAVHNLTLVRAAGTGIKVIAEGTGLKLFVDGKEVGPLPQQLKDMDPGDHVIKVAGNDRFEAFEKHVNVQAEQMQTIGPLKLKVVKGLASIVPGPGSDGARVLLVSGNDRRTLPKLPINLDIPTNRPHTIVATKRGYGTFRKPITFEDGKAEKTFEVTMVEVGDTSEPTKPSRRSKRAPRSRRAPKPSPRASAPSGGKATLNINSIPVSNIILDGRPMGPTPKVGVRVGGGSHTIVFISGSQRKAASVTVGAGQTKTVAVRF